MTVQVASDNTPWYLAPNSQFDAVLVFVCVLCFCSGVIANVLCVVAFFSRRRSCLTADVVLVAIYLIGIVMLFQSMAWFHLQFMVNSKSQYIEFISNSFLTCAMPYSNSSLHMAVFYMLTLIGVLQYLNIAWPQYSLRPRHVVGLVLAIIAFSFLVNIHFLLANCPNFVHQLYIEYDKTTSLKFVFVDGAAFVFALVFLIRTLVTIHTAQQHLPDRHLLRDDCLAFILLLFVVATPEFVGSLFGLVELYSPSGHLSLRFVHFDLVLTLKIVSLASIPLVTSTTRPASRLDVNGLFDRWRDATDRMCFSSRDPAEPTFSQRLRISMSGAGAILGESAEGPTDDREQILSVAQFTDDPEFSETNGNQSV